MVDRQQNQLDLRSSHGLPEVILLSLLQLHLRPGEGIPGAVLQRSESVLLDGRAYRDLCGRVSPRNVANVRQLIEHLPRGLHAVALPLRIGTEVIGVLELINLGTRPHLSHPDLKVLQTFANLAAGAIKNAQLHAQMQSYQHRLEAFSAIGTVVSAAADLDELVSNVLDVVLSVVSSNTGMLLLLDPSRAALRIGAQRNLPASYLECYGQVAIVGADCEEAVRYGQPIRRPLIAEGGEELLIEAGLGSCAYIPLLAGGTVVGVIGIFGDAQLPARIDTQALMMIGNLIGFAIANVQLYQDSQNERRKLSAVINSIAEGVVLCDRSGNLALANQTALELLSIEHFPYSLPDRELSQMFAFRDLDGAPLAPGQVPLTRALNGAVYHDYRLLVKGASGSDSVLSFTGAPVYGEANQVEGAVVIFRDVTASQKLERAKDDFLAVAAHELRSPLAAVRGYTDLLVRRAQRGPMNGSDDMRGIVVLSQQVGHMLRLVDNLLDVSRLDAGQFSLHLQDTDLRMLVEQVIEQLRPAASDRSQLIDGILADVHCVCDPLRIRQVLTNLLSNAVRYSPSNTRITVALSAWHPVQLAIHHNHFATSWWAARPIGDEGMIALLSVADQGNGIGPDQMARLFKRSVRGRQRSGEGLGLGLYLCHEFVSYHHGIIWAESHEGRGSTFYVALPLSGPPADPASDQD
jgi:two-component system phosphate regulon sensor histidine kinase PhoR